MTLFVVIISRQIGRTIECVITCPKICSFRTYISYEVWFHTKYGFIQKSMLFHTKCGFIQSTISCIVSFSKYH